MSINPRRPHGQHMNESATLAGIWPEIEGGLKQVYVDKTTMSRKEYMELYTYPFIRMLYVFCWLMFRVSMVNGTYGNVCMYSI